MAFKDWSTTAATNSNADATINWAEGQAPSTVNDSARAMMAALAVWYAQISSGTIVTGTVGGTVDAITLTNSPTVPSAQMKYGSKFLFTPAGTSSSTTPTLNVDGIGAKTIQYRGSALVAGDITATPTLVVYDGTNFQIVGPIPSSKNYNAGGTTIGTSQSFTEVFVTRNAQTGTTYTIATSDRGKHVTLSNASAIAVTLPQANGTGFTSGFYTYVENIGAGTVTITPTTSTINGGATIKLGTGEGVLITSDSTNYRALAMGNAYTQISGLTEDTQPDGAADFVASADSSLTIAKKVKFQAVHSPSSGSKTASYTVTDLDRGTSIRFAGLAADATVTLPAASGRAGFLLYLSNEDTTDTAPFGMIVDPNGAELIDGFATRKGYVGTRITILCDGTGWRTVQGYYRYFSGDQTITAAGTLTLPHGLGVRPRRFFAELKSTTAEFGYTIGDIVPIGPSGDDEGTNNRNHTMTPDATNLNVRFSQAAGGTYIGMNKTTGVRQNLTNGSWKVRFYAED
jgi:hypothetical protein